MELMELQTTKTYSFFVPFLKGSKFFPLAVLLRLSKATHCTQVLFRLEGSVVEKPSGRVEASFCENLGVFVAKKKSLNLKFKNNSYVTFLQKDVNFFVIFAAVVHPESRGRLGSTA
jgi:hypothetical protein